MWPVRMALSFNKIRLACLLICFVTEQEVANRQWAISNKQIEVLKNETLNLLI